MADDDPGIKCKQRFKGIENFLRRVAYNLGNSPSQTEVKIISCIPIDVTDLQQKIIHLERQLEVATASNNNKKQPQTMCVQRAACPPSCGYNTPPTCYDPCASEPPTTCGNKKSAVSFACPEPNGGGCTACEPDKPCKKGKLFKKKQKKNSQVICYYAQTTNDNPFSKYKSLSVKRDTQNTDDNLSGPFVSSDIIRKQYRAELYLEDTAGSSQEWAPVCRDCEADADAAGPGARATEVCSCCHGRYHDLDQDMQSYHLLSPTSIHTAPQAVDHSVYYDSSYYDLIPVKEKPDKIKRDSEAKKREAKVQLDTMYWPKNYRRYPDRNPLIMNCILPPRPRCMRPPIRYQKKRDRPIPRTWCKSVYSRNTLVECGDTYMKQPVEKKRRPKTVLLKNAECITLNVNDSECQTESSKSIQPPETTTDEPVENKTEVTLNQIKSILQSVLTQVKTNNLAKNQHQERNTKDANVQNLTPDSSQDRSRILNSFTYSPFAINPYMAACAPPEAPASCPGPTMHHSMSMPPPGTSFPPSHFQNYPLFIHRTPAKQPQYTSCCHPFQKNKSAQPKQTSTTELPRVEIHSKETESLIKEIYKSVALNVNDPTNDTPHSDYDGHKPAPADGAINESGEPVVSNLVTLSRQVGSSAQKVYTRPTQLSAAVASRATSSSGSAASKQSGDQRPPQHPDPSGLRGRTAREPAMCESGTATTSQGHTLKSCIVEESLSEEEGEDDDESSASESEEDSDETVIVPTSKSTKKPRKKGLLSKVFGSVFQKRRKKEKEEYEPSISEDDTETTDSDDYQTVCSEPVEKPSKHVRYAPSSKDTAKQDFYHKRSPYGDRQSQCQAPDHRARSAPRPPGIYFQNFETRSAFLNSSRPDYSQRRPEYVNFQSKALSPLPPRTNVGIKLTKQAKWMNKKDVGFKR